MKSKSTGDDAYNERHPVMSFRVDRDDLEFFKQAIAEQGEDMGQFLRDALQKKQENLDLAHSRGFREGYYKAKRKYALYLTCDACGESVALVDEEMKEMAANDFTLNCSYRALHEGCSLPAGYDTSHTKVMEGERRREAKPKAQRS